MKDVIALEGKYHSPWTKIKFYKEKPDIETTRELKNIRFCEAIKECQRTYSIIVDRKSINCLGAKYVLGWENKKHEIIGNCVKKWNIPIKTAKSILNKTQILQRKISYIGFNVDGTGDVFISYVQPEEMMYILRIFQHKTGREFETSFSSVMSICGIAVRAYIDGKIHMSFGCEDSRNYGEINRDRLAIAVPTSLIELFI